MPALGAVAGAFLVIALQGGLPGKGYQLTQRDITTRCYMLETQPLPSPAAKAYQVIGSIDGLGIRTGARGCEAGRAGDHTSWRRAAVRSRPSPNGVRSARPRRNRRRATRSNRRMTRRSPDPGGPDGRRHRRRDQGTAGGHPTYLHVVGGAQRISVTFADGTESEVTITGALAGTRSRRVAGRPSCRTICNRPR